MDKSQLIEKYILASNNFRLLESKEDKLLFMLSVLRLIIFIGGLALIWFGFTVNLTVGFISILVFTVIFLYLLNLYSLHSEQKEFLSNLVVINQNEGRALTGDLSEFDAGNSYTDSEHAFSNDVDLFGTSSLFQYLNRSVTSYGRDILANWLSDPFLLARNLILRQDAINELAKKEKWRQEFMASGMKKSLGKSDISSLLEWMEEDPLIQSSSINKYLIYLLPAAAIISLLLVVTGILPYTVFTFIFLFNLFYHTL